MAYYKKTDLDNFPTGKTAKRMLERISPIYDRSYIMKWILEVMGAEWDTVKDYVKTLPLQRFPEVVTWGIKYLEQKYGLETDETLTLEERRARVIAARPQKKSVTPYFLEQLAEKISGIDVEITESPSDYLFTIDIVDTGESFDCRTLVNAFDEVKQSHTDYRIHLEGEFEGAFYTGGVIVSKHMRTVIYPSEEQDTFSVAGTTYTGGTVIAKTGRTTIEASDD